LSGQDQMSKQIQSGFSLVELIVVMALMGVVASIAAPNVSEMMAQFRRNSVVGELITDLNTARSEAIKSGQPVIVACQGAPCAYTPISWTGGWQICYSVNGATCAVSTTLRVNPIKTAGALVSGQIVNANSLSVPFVPTGYMQSTTKEFQIGARALAATDKKVITVTSSGSISSLDK
jgi:type IV fimbrial biogenesis protein FimT